MTASLKTIYPYSDIANFKTDKVTIVDGKAVLDTPLKDVRPMMLNFQNGIAPTVAADKTFEVLLGSDADSQKLDCKGDTQRGVIYALSENLSGYTNKITFRGKFIPAFASGSNSNIYPIFSILDADNKAVYALQYHNGIRSFNMHYLRDNGTTVPTSNSPVVNFTSGQEIEFELNQNFETDRLELFIDGVHSVGMNTPDVVRDFADVTKGYKLLLGANAGNRHANHEIDDFEIFTSLLRQDTQNFVNEIPRVTPGQYETSGSICTHATIFTDKLVSLTPTDIETVNTEIRYTLEVNGVEKYFNGTTWENSTGQTNTLDEINTNAESLDLSQGVALIVKAYLSGNGDETPELDELRVDFRFYKNYAERKTTLVHNKLLHADGTPVVGAKVKVTKERTIKQGEALFLNRPIETTTSEDGKLVLPIVETESSKQPVTIEIDYDDGSKPERFEGIVIPDRETVTLSELIK